jgi:predicted amidohydrolase
LRLAAIQYKPNKGNFQESLEGLLRLANEAAKDSDLLVFPEMALTGYVFEDRVAIAAVAEPAMGRSFQALSKVALAHGVWIVFGFPEVDGEQFFNSALVINPAGELVFTYRKTLLYEQDEAWATPGDSGYRYFETDWGRFGVGICMDLNDDDFIRWCMGAALDVIAFPTNWIEEGVDVWTYWAWRLQGINAALVAANTYGEEGDIRFSGRSAILKVNRVYAAAGPVGDGAIRRSF